MQKIFYTLIGTFVYLYLFLTIGGSFDLQLGFISAHPLATVILVVGGAALIYLVARMLRERIREWWGEAKVGGQVLTQPRAYFGHVLFPEVISYAAMLGIIAVFLAAYNIPVSFHTLMRVVAGNSIANATSVTPGRRGCRAGLQRALAERHHERGQRQRLLGRPAARDDRVGHPVRDRDAVRAFGWSDGRTLVAQSYGQAKEKSAEQSAARKAKRQAKRETRHHAATSADQGDEALDAR